MGEKRKHLIIATAVVALLAAAAPAWNATAAGITSPFGHGNPLDSLQAQVDDLKNQLQNALNPPSPATLTGDYSVVANVDCMYVTGSGFGSGLTVPPNTFAFTQHMTAFGTIHYNGDGTATQTEKLMSVADVTNPGPSQIRTGTSTCPVTYAVNADGTFTQVKGNCTSIGGDGSTTTIQGSVPLQGRISNRGKMLLLAGTTPSIETITNSGGTSHRVCTRGIVGTKIN